jgi:hypothetical protein
LNAWEIRMRWGDRALEAEVIDGRGRKTLSLGDAEKDDFVIGGGARLLFDWVEGGLQVKFSTGVGGTATLGGKEPVGLGQLIEQGVVKESGGTYSLGLTGNDALQLQVAGQVIEVNRARGRVARLSLDPWATLALIIGLGLLLAWVGVTLSNMEAMNLLNPKQ